MKRIFILMAAAVLIAGECVAGSAQNVYVCQIKPTKFAMPSYTFKVVDLNGQPIDDASGTGTMILNESIWQGGIDGFWSDIPHPYPVALSQAADKHVWTSDAIHDLTMPKVAKVPGLFSWGLLDDPLRTERARFDFTRPNGESGFFIFFFQGGASCQKKFPDPRQPIKVVIQYDKSGNGLPK
jgi:hypothetical protein